MRFVSVLYSAVSLFFCFIIDCMRPTYLDHGNSNNCRMTLLEELGVVG